MENLPAVKNESIFFDVVRFEHAQRVARVFCTSTMVPDHFQGEKNLGNTLIAMNYADRIGADLFMTMQNMCVIHGKPGIEGKLVISLINHSGRFDPVEFEEIGNLRKPENDEHGCIAFTRDLKSGKVLKGPMVDWAMVRAEGWFEKRGSKWKTMAPLMFRYRAATYFARTHCPEVLLGMQTREELQDIVTLRPTDTGAYEVDTTTGSVKISDKRDTSLYDNPSAKNLDNEKVSKPGDTVGNESMEPVEVARHEKIAAPTKVPDKPQASTTQTDSQPPDGWDPRREPLQRRYLKDKQQILQSVAMEMGIDTAELKTGAEIHRAILSQYEQLEPGPKPTASIEARPGPAIPAEKNEVPPNTMQVREKFFNALRERGFDDEKVVLADQCLQHHVRTLNQAPLTIMKTWLEDIDRFFEDFETWRKPVLDPVTLTTEKRQEAVGKANILRRYNDKRWDAIVKTRFRAHELPSISIDAWTDDQLLDVIAEFEAVDTHGNDDQEKF